jgi:protein-tyrosine phosphatase
MPELFLVEWPMPGRLALMARPAGGETLETEIAALRAAGVDKLVSALTSRDQSKLELENEAALAVAAGISFVAFPIHDFGTPDRDALVDLAAELADDLRHGRFVTIHCRGGVGRSGLIACAVVIDFGASAEEAIEVVSQARGCTAPETEEQRQMLRDLAA